jgi:hypothetical protein
VAGDGEVVFRHRRAEEDATKHYAFENDCAKLASFTRFFDTQFAAVASSYGIGERNIAQVYPRPPQRDRFHIIFGGTSGAKIRLSTGSEVRVAGPDLGPHGWTRTRNISYGACFGLLCRRIRLIYGEVKYEVANLARTWKKYPGASSQ